MCIDLYLFFHILTNTIIKYKPKLLALYFKKKEIEGQSLSAKIDPDS